MTANKALTPPTGSATQPHFSRSLKYVLTLLTRISLFVCAPVVCSGEFPETVVVALLDGSPIDTTIIEAWIPHRCSSASISDAYVDRPTEHEQDQPRDQTTYAMVDPFSIIGAVSVTIDAVERTKCFLEGITGAPKAVESLSKEFSTVGQLLHQINTFVRRLHADGVAGQDSFGPHLQDALQNCQKLALDVEELLKPYLQPTGESSRNILKRISWTFKAEKVARIEKDIATCKQTLNIAVSFADLYGCTIISSSRTLTD